MSNAKQRFFIALLPPQPIQAYANKVKQIFVDRYQSQAAFNSPPHITLQPPFEWSMADLPQLQQVLSEFAAQQAAVAIDLVGFGAFAPRVVYLNVQPSTALLALQTALSQHLKTTLGIVSQTPDRPFVPHLTVGFRDLTPENFRAAWAEFQHQPVDFHFTASQLTLLLHDGQQWTVFIELPLAVPPQTIAER